MSSPENTRTTLALERLKSRGFSTIEIGMLVKFFGKDQSLSENLEDLIETPNETLRELIDMTPTRLMIVDVKSRRQE